MSDLINRKALLKELNKWDISKLCLVDDFKELVKEQPTINQYDNLIKKIKGELKQSSSTKYICESCKIINTDVGYVEEWFDEYIGELEGDKE